MATKIAVLGHYSNVFSTVREALAGDGCDVSAVDHDDALAGQLALHRPDAVILDVGSFDGDAGWDLLDRLKSSTLLPGTPIIVCASHIHDVQDHRDCLTEVAAVLVDPCTEEDVRYCVRAAVPGADLPARETMQTLPQSGGWPGYEIEEVTIATDVWAPHTAV